MAIQNIPYQKDIRINNKLSLSQKLPDRGPPK